MVRLPRFESCATPAPSAIRATWCGLIVLGLATFLMAETAFAFRELTSVACGVGSWRLTARLIPISDGNYVMYPQISARRNSI